MLTNELRLGQMFNVVPQWHPLRLAEDFAIADILTHRARARPSVKETNRLLQRIRVAA